MRSRRPEREKLPGFGPVLGLLCSGAWVQLVIICNYFEWWGERENPPGLVLGWEREGYRGRKRRRRKALGAPHCAVSGRLLMPEPHFAVPRRLLRRGLMPEAHFLVQDLRLFFLFMILMPRVG